MSAAITEALETVKKEISTKEAALAPLRKQLADKEAELNPLKITANQLSKLLGRPEEFSISADGSPAVVASGPGIKIRPDQFFNKELGEAVVTYLSLKKELLGGEAQPGTVDEIYDALVSGGYKFNGTSDATKKAALKTAMTRNTAQMVKISDDLYGLRKWYGMRAARKSGAAGGGDDDSGDDAASENQGEKPASNSSPAQ